MVELQVRMNDGTRFIVEVENYDAKALETEINDHQKMMIALGNAIIQKHSVVSIMPLDQVEEDINA